jgi:hypothetical protein
LSVYISAQKCKLDLFLYFILEIMTSFSSIKQILSNFFIDLLYKNIINE